MPNPIGPIKTLHHEESGVTSIEYALLGFLIAVAIIITVKSVGTNLLDLYEKVASAVTA